jgi:hypothetical protein
LRKMIKQVGSDRELHGRFSVPTDHGGPVLNTTTECRWVQLPLLPSSKPDPCSSMGSLHSSRLHSSGAVILCWTTDGSNHLPAQPIAGSRTPRLGYMPCGCHKALLPCGLHCFYPKQSGAAALHANLCSMDHDSGMHGTSGAVSPARESKTWGANDVCEIPGGKVWRQPSYSPCTTRKYVCVDDEKGGAASPS